MRIPVEWLGEYVDIQDVSVENLSEALTLSGTENEILKSEGGFEGVVVGEIKKIERHPNADKLNVAGVDVGKKSELKIVCSAPNLEVGQKVPVALVGAVIGEFEIKEMEMRGVKSEGMLCSESELGISDDHSGIMILDARSKIGESLDKSLGSGGTVIDAELTPNRGDCLSIVGVAREAVAATGTKLKHTDFKKPEIKSKKKIEVDVQDKELCPRYIAKVVEGVKVEPSPKWMADRLSVAGVRPINNIVDVTNYVMLEWGQPLHAFGMEKLQMTPACGTGRNSKCQIKIRKAKNGEKIQTLDGVERKLTASDLVIADTKEAIAVAGVMGGANSEVTEKTRDIVLEAAVFDKTSIRKTAQRLGLRSEASNRFEKGIPLGLPEIAIERASQLLTELSAESRGIKTQNNADKNADGRGTQIKVGENTDILSGKIWPQCVGVRLSRVEKFLGIKIPVERQIDILKSLGFEAEKFDFKKEARKHVGKPYVFGAKFKTHGDMAFDCSYLTDYIYRQIGKFIGHTALGQYEIGEPVKGELLPGDVLFCAQKGLPKEKGHYFITDLDGNKEKVEVKPPKEVGHCGIYIGNGRVVHAHMLEYDYKAKKWIKSSKNKTKVEEDSVEIFTKNPEYLGARRYTPDPADWLSVTVPWWRLDVKIEEDIFEEIARIFGYDKFPSTLPTGELPRVEENNKLKLTSDVKNILAGAGFSEVYNYSFVSEKMLTETGTLAEKALKIANPISPEQEYMRTNLTSSLLSNAAKNQDNFEDINIFEIASCYLPVKSPAAAKAMAGREELPREVLTLAICVKSKKDGEGFSRLKGILELLSKKLNLPDFELLREEGKIFEKGRLASVSQKGERLGAIGEISNRTKLVFSLKHDFAILHINLRKLIDRYDVPRKYQSISKYPTSIRDISALFSKTITAEKVKSALKGAKTKELKEFWITDIYASKQLEKDKKSITIRLVFGSNQKTLEEGEIENSFQVVLGIINKLGGDIRS